MCATEYREAQAAVTIAGRKTRQEKIDPKKNERKLLAAAKARSAAAKARMTKAAQMEEAGLDPYERLLMGGTDDARYARFVEEYVIDFNGRRAAIAAGYQEANAAKLAYQATKVQKVKAAIDFLRKKLAEESGVTASKVRADIEQTRRMAISSGNLAVAVKCSELQGRSIAMFTDKVEHEGDLLKSLSDKDLDERIKHLAAQAGIAAAARREDETDSRE